MGLKLDPDFKCRILNINDTGYLMIVFEENLASIPAFEIWPNRVIKATLYNPDYDREVEEIDYEFIKFSYNTVGL